MGVTEWAAVAGILTVFVTLGTIVWRLASRLATTESTNTQLQINVQANTQRVETMARLLSEHKEQAAEKYVSYGRMTELETKLVGAINNLGDRIDRLFQSGRTVVA